MTDNSWRPQNVFADAVAQEEKHKAENLENYVRKENHCSISAFVVTWMDENRNLNLFGRIGGKLG